MENNKIKYIIRDLKGKKQLQEVLNKYSKSIIEAIEENPDILPSLLESLEMTPEELFDKLMNNSENITFYDNALTYVKNSKL